MVPITGSYDDVFTCTTTMPATMSRLPRQPSVSRPSRRGALVRSPTRPVLRRYSGLRCRPPLFKKRWMLNRSRRPRRIEDLDEWLQACPAVAASIVWEDSGGPHAWPSWSAAWKNELMEAFALARSGGSITVPDVPRNLAVLADNDPATTLLTPADAWAYYKASVARSLAAQIGRQLGWSLTGYTAPELAQLFDSREMFRWNAVPAGYRIEDWHGSVTPAPPAYIHDFLATAGLIGNSRLDTIVRVLDWCRANLHHMGGGLDTLNMEHYWQYRGRPPVVRVLTGTVLSSDTQLRLFHWTAGCWGTVGLLRALLRVVNIPVKLLGVVTHAQPWFMADDRYLDHGDDPYNILLRADPPVPMAEVLINGTTYNEWFGPGASDAQRWDNINRRPIELAVSYLPNYLLRAYCSDIDAGKTHDNGTVKATLRIYTVRYLEDRGLWARMDTKIAGLGGCDHIPP